MFNVFSTVTYNSVGACCTQVPRSLIPKYAKRVLILSGIAAGLGYYLYRKYRNRYSGLCEALHEYHDQEHITGLENTELDVMPVQPAYTIRPNVGNRPRAYISDALDTVRLSVGYLPDSKANRMVVSKALRDHFRGHPDVRKRDAARMILEAEFFYFLKTPDENFLEQLASTSYARKQRRSGERP